MTLRTATTGKGHFAALVLLLILTPGVATATDDAVEFEGVDGSVYQGTAWNAGGSAGFILLPQCERDRSMFGDLGEQIAAAGFRVLAVDLPNNTESDDSRALLDQAAEAAFAHLGQATAVLGAGCGGGAAVRLSKAHPEITHVGLLSAGLSAHEERDALQLSGRQLLLVASKGDGPAIRPAGTIAYRKGRRSAKLKTYDGDLRGAALLEEDPQLIEFISRWFAPALEDTP